MQNRSLIISATCDGLVRINERVEFFKARMDVEPKSVKILDLRHRWASWTPGGNLNFHWMCMMSPAKILDYIVVHELAHLLHSVLERG